MIAGVFEAPAWLLAKFYDLTGSYGVSIALIAVVVMLLITPADAEEHQGHARDAAPRAGDAPAAEPVPQRPDQAQRRDDEALPGAQGQPDVVVPAAAGSDAGLHHHVPDPPRPDVQADREAPRRSPMACSLRVDNAAPSSGSSPATSRRRRTVPVARRSDRDDVARSRPREVTGRGARRRLRRPA